MRNSTIFAAILCCILAITVGCQKSVPEPDAADPPPVVAKTSVEENDTAKPAKSPPSADTVSPTQQERAAGADAAASIDDEKLKLFEPPFGQRVDFFAPPQRTQQVVKKNDATNEAVALQGFANVDEQRVVLAVNGIIAPMAAGEKRYGIHVISIQPPKVVLQRGGERWTAILNN